MCKSCIPKQYCQTKIGLHNHTDYSNLRLRDSINTIEDLVTTALQLNYKGIAITEHEFIGSHHKAIKFVEEGKKDGSVPQDFKLILGNEIYLVEDAKWCEENYYNPEAEVKFFHYLLLAKNKEGHKALRKLSSRAWENSFTTGLMARVPTEEHYLETIVKEHPNTLMATSACMGGRIPFEIMKSYSHVQLAKKIESGVTLPTQSDRQKHNKLKTENNKKYWGSSNSPLAEKIEKFTPQYSYEENQAIESGWKLTAQEHYQLAKEAMKRAEEYIQWNIDLFGKDDFYLELQPATYQDQIIVNKQLVKFAEEFGLKLIITSDAHYSRPEEAPIHEAFLNAQEGDREVADFYGHTYLHTIEETYEKMNYLPKEIISQALENTLEIGSKVEEYSLEQETIIPRINLPEFQLRHLFKTWYDQYEYIGNMCNSDEEQDRYLMHLIEEGFLELIPYKEFSKEKFHEYLARINEEVGELWKLSKKMNQAVSSYYVTTARLVDILWADDECEGSFDTGSLVGYGRGSAVAFLINYLMKITMVNPLEYGLEIPAFRHISSEMANISSLDIDIDINATKRQHIFNRLKEEFGEDNFLQVSTVMTEAPKSAVKTACRGLGISDDVANYLSSLIPFERGSLWDIKDCLYGNEKKQRKPIKQFVDEIAKYDKLEETVLKVQGLINGRSTHAGGVVVLNSHYIEQNALMRSGDGTAITQFNLEDTQALGAIKMDLLSLDALTKIQENFNYLIKDGVINKEDSLRKTFEKYFRPDRLDIDGKEIFELASSGTVQDLFQFSTEVGYGAVTHAKPNNMIDLMALNSIMRLMNRLGKTPLETFAEFKENIQLWYDEMKEYNLTQDEIQFMEEHLLKLSGIADTQESAMLLAMDKRMCGFNVQEATQLRKVIAGSNEKNLRELKELIYRKGKKQGTSENLLNYFWEVQLGAQLG